MVLSAFYLWLMTKAEKENLKEKIIEAIQQTEQKILKLEEDTQPISPENAIGRISRMDAINNKSVSEAALRSAKKKLSNLKISLSKLDRTDFGQCSRCGQNIQTARLMYMPQSSRCVHCAD